MREFAWPLALAAATIAGTLATACMMPFVGLAVAAAATMRRREALVTVVGAWAANQLLGFGLLGYPLDGHAVAWGAALGAASVAAMLVAHRLRGSGPAAIVVAFAAAFAVDEALLLGFALIAGGTETFAPGIVARLLLNDAMWCAGLLALHRLLATAAPRTFAAAR